MHLIVPSLSRHELQPVIGPWRRVVSRGGLRKGRLTVSWNLLETVSMSFPRYRKLPRTCLQIRQSAALCAALSFDVLVPRDDGACRLT
eukprot:938570-Pleurochrysis_carterae.AAC.1